MLSFQSPPELIIYYLEGIEVHHEMGMSYDDSVVLTVDNSFITGDLDESILELHWEHWFLDCVGNHVVFRFDGFV